MIKREKNQENERKGKERKGKERKGKERKGKERKGKGGKERKGEILVGNLWNVNKGRIKPWWRAVLLVFSPLSRL